MITQQAQIKINLPLRLKDFLESKAKKFGVPTAAYVKHLIMNDVKEMEYPEFEPSDRTIRAYKRAMKHKKEGKLIKVTNLDKFFKEL